MRVGCEEDEGREHVGFVKAGYLRHQRKHPAETRAVHGAAEETVKDREDELQARRA
jgi:hypothetical protein